MKPSIALISANALQIASWRTVLQPQLAEARSFPSLAQARAQSSDVGLLIVALESAQQIAEIAQWRSAGGECIAIAGGASANLAVDALRVGIDCLLEVDALFAEVLQQRVVSECAALALRERLAILERAAQQTQREVALAAQTQSRFRPASPFVSGGLVACHAVFAAGQLSGDCVDYFRLADGRFVFYVADVAGHGLSAALLTPLLKSFSLRLSRGLPDHSLAELLAEFSADITALDSGKHVALFAGIIDVAERSLCYCSAGHAPPPMLVSATDARLLAVAGKPLGLFPGVSYREEVIALPASYTIAVFSDGVLDLVAGEDASARQATLMSLVRATAGDLHALSQGLGLSPDREYRDDVECLLLTRAGA